MTHQTEALNELVEEVNTLKLQKAQLEAELNQYHEQFERLQQQKYGSKSEKVPAEKLSLFNDVELVADESIEEPTYEDNLST